MIMRASVLSLPILSLTVLLTMTPAAHAQTQVGGLTYFEDPVYEKISPEDHHPMDDMILYAQAGDTRAQYILGDMYGKGKGGFAKNEKKAREWFEMAARNGEIYSFVRLAALAKHHKNWTEAYQWYYLATQRSHHGDDDRKWAASQLKKLKDEGKVSGAEIKTAEKDAAAWTEKSKELLKADQELQKLKEPEAEALALQDNLEPEKNAEKEAAKKTEPAKTKKEEPKPAEEPKTNN